MTRSYATLLQEFPSLGSVHPAGTKPPSGVGLILGFERYETTEFALRWAKACPDMAVIDTAYCFDDGWGRPTADNPYGLLPGVAFLPVGTLSEAQEAVKRIDNRFLPWMTEITGSPS
jgi:hypothetical protein